MKTGTLKNVLLGLGLVGGGVYCYKTKKENNSLKKELGETQAGLEIAKQAIQAANYENVKLAYSLGKEVMKGQKNARLVCAMRHGNKPTDN